jgi:hypothetical protein
LNESFRQGWIKNVPVFKDLYDSQKVKVPRQWFTNAEYSSILNAVRSHKKSLKGTRWEADADELYDYIVFVTNAGLRVGEARNIRFMDVSLHEEISDGERRIFLMLKNIKGKRGTGECRTIDGAVAAFERRVAARKIKHPSKSTENIFQAYHRDMFRTILEKTDLRFSKERPPRKRDLTVLRHTYICMRLNAGASVFQVAANCRTSVQMIEDHYAKWLSPQKMTLLNVLNRKKKPTQS